jgi:hypothetical protein
MIDYCVNITRDYCVNITRDLVFESHTPAVYIYRRYELTADSNLSTFLFSTLLFGWQTSPSIFTLRDFVAAIAGLFLRRLCDLPFLYVWIQHYERFGFIVMRDYCVNITRDLVFESHHTPAVYFTVGMNWRISRRFYFQPSLLVINIRRPSLLSTTSSSVHSYGGYATSLFIRLDSLVREIWIHCYERLLINVMIDSYSTLL